MKRGGILTILFVAGWLMLWAGQAVMAGTVGTAWTYQGRLIDANKTADGEYDFQFKLFDVEADGNQLGTDVNKMEVDVIDGFFIVELDFGNVFHGNERWLQIGIRPGKQSDPNVYTTLSPRQELTPTPYALYAKTAGSGGGESLWQVNGFDIYYNNGNVGIGTTTPSSPLTIKTVTGNDIELVSTGSNADIMTNAAFKVGTSTSQPFSIITNNLYRMTVDSDGNVGIGTNSPFAKLQVISSDDGNPTIFGINNTNGTGIVGIGIGPSNSGIYGEASGGTDGHYARGVKGKGIGVYSSGVKGEHEPSGNLGQLGDSNCGVYGENPSAGNNGYLGGPLFGVYGMHEADGLFEGALGSENEGLFARHRSSGNWAQLGCSDCAGHFYGNVKITTMPVIVDNNIPVYYNLMTGELGIVGSSARFKKDIKPLTDDFYKILQATPKSFIGKEGGEKGVGFIAEEFDALGLKNLVYYKDGQPFGVKYDRIAIYLLEVMKDQAKAIKGLTEENDSLKKRLEALERTIKQNHFTDAKEVQK
jgi:hypothetical protein